MKIRAESLVLDESVRPVSETGMTAQTGLTGPETGLIAQSPGNTDSAAGKAED